MRYKLTLLLLEDHQSFDKDKPVTIVVEHDPPKPLVKEYANISLDNFAMREIDRAMIALHMALRPLR